MKSKIYKKLTSFVTAVTMVIGTLAVLVKGYLSQFGLTVSAEFDDIVSGMFMKKIKLFSGKVLSLMMTMLMLMLFTFTAFPVYADDTYLGDVSSTDENPASDFIYSEFKSIITIEKYIGSSKNVVIPSVIDDRVVGFIGEGAFADNPNVESVVISKTVFGIAREAFKNCTNLKNVTIPDSVTRIWEYAFRDCTNLKSVVIPDSVEKIGMGAFRKCSSLTYVKLPNGISEINQWTFAECTALTSITIPGSVTIIYENAFNNSGLTSIVIPSGVTEICWAAFSDCSSLRSVTISDSVSTIRAGAFKNCPMLTEFIVDDQNPYYTSVDGVLFTKAIDKIVQYPKGKTGNSYTIPDTVTVIEDLTFFNCSGLTAVNIPSSVTSIGGDAFSNCTGLTSVTIPGSVTYIGESAFSECTGLTSVSIPVGSTSFGYGVFSYCTGLTSVDIPNGVTSIGDGTFVGCTGLTSVTIPGSVTTIGGSAFSDCTDLTSVNISNGVTIIGDGAFGYCTGLTSVDIPNSVTSIGWAAFRGCTGLTSLTIPDSVTFIGGYIFADCSNLTSVNILGNITSIEEWAFYDCSSLTTVNIPESVTYIGTEAFAYCHNLTSLKIPNSVKFIGERAFAYCESLATVNIPNGVESIGNETFIFCCELTSIFIPGSITSIGSKAFYECNTMTKVEISNGVNSIGDEAFAGCRNLTYITIPESVDSIGERAFANCNYLIAVTIPESVTAIGNNAFEYCNHFTIYGKAGSYAEKYAADNNIPFAENSIVTFISQPENTIVKAGQDAHFSVSISNGNAYYYWCEIKKPTPGETVGWETLDNEEKPSLTIKNVDESMNGYMYRCDISVDGTHVCSRYALLTVIPASDTTEHVNIHRVETIPPTCTRDGVAEFICDDCGVKVYDESIPALGHIPSEEYTCLEIGHYRECNRIGCMVKIDAGNHISDEGKVTTEPTSDSEGVMTYSCSVCGYVIKTETIPAIGTEHTHSFGTEWKSDSTSHWHECTCGEKSEVATHTRDEGSIVKEATLNEDGLISYHCSVCSAQMDDEVVKLTIDSIEVTSDRVIVKCINSINDEITNIEYDSYEVTAELVDIMKETDIQLVIDFVNSITAASSEYILTSAQLKAIEYVLEYDYSKAA